MKTIVISSPWHITIGEREKPKPEEGEVLLKIDRIGYCGTDLSTFRGLNPLVSYPRVPGHEIAGSIVELGSGVPGHFKIGQKATVIPYTSCGNCSACRKGKFNACKNNETLGVQREGALTEFIAVPFEKVLTSEKHSFTELAFVEPLAVGFHAVDRANVTSEDIVAVYGVGMIGLGAVAAAGIRRNLRVIAIDIDDRKLDLAKKAGATWTINSLKENLHARLEELTDDRGPDVMIEAVGLPFTFQSCVEEVCYGGRVVYIGYAKEPVSYETKYFILKELDVLGSRGSTKKDFEEVMFMLEEGLYPTEETLTQTVPFKLAAKAMEDWDSHAGAITKIHVRL
jgi:L-galactonate 5-dehydrogenase